MNQRLHTSNGLKAWLAPAIIIALLSFGTSFVGSYGGRQSADGASKQKLLDIEREVQKNSQKIDDMDKRLRTEVVGRDLYLQFVESQKEASNGIKEQLTQIREHQR